MIAPTPLHGFLAHELGGELGGAIEIAACMRHDDPLFLRDRCGCRLKTFEQHIDPRVADRRVPDFSHDRLLIGPLVGAIRRQVHLLIPAQQFGYAPEKMCAF